MRKYIKYLCGLCLFCVLGASFTSCEDMLTPDSERHSSVVGQDTLYSYLGIIKSLQNVAERYIVLGECRGDLVDGTTYLSDSIKSILDFDRDKAVDGSCRYLRASDYYHIVNSCNAYLAMCDKERVTGTLQPYMLKEAAQVEAIRAWVYLQLIQVYGSVPFFTDPKLSTDDINDFMQAPEMADASNLADKLAPSLIAAQKIEMEYGMPEYDKFGKDGPVCHSSKVMIPLNIILGDLYLTKGDAASCATAAQYYYNYLSNNQGQGNVVPGGALPDDYYSYGYKGEGMDKTVYSCTKVGRNSIWFETDETRSDKEAITAIPSTTNKLWGTVLRGVNELYGYSSEISVQTDTSSTTSASVRLFPQYDVKQVTASENYFKLCKDQTFEVYIAATNNSFNQADYILTPDPEVGDARQYWVQDVRQTYSNGLSNTEKFITKQNPGGQFTTVFPMIYRKAQVWLRYAEALNRAGYPSFAFAILKNGLCNNDSWYPQPSNTLSGNTDYAVKDSAWVFIAADGTQYPADGSKATTAELEAYLADLVTEGTLTDDDITAGRKDWDPVSYEDFTNDNCTAALYYLDRSELENTPSYLNFKFESLYGNATSADVFCRTKLTQSGMSFVNAGGGGTGSDAITVGIHSRGCGMVFYGDKRSSYDYVKLITKIAQERYGQTITKAEIYDGSQQDLVEKCIEDLIVDEEALELAFEGTRFFDLMRVAMRRGDPDYLASRVAMRSGTNDPALYTKLLTPSNWFFKLP